MILSSPIVSSRVVNSFHPLSADQKPLYSCHNTPPAPPTRPRFSLLCSAPPALLALLFVNLLPLGTLSERFVQFETFALLSPLSIHNKYEGFSDNTHYVE